VIARGQEHIVELVEAKAAELKAATDAAGILVWQIP
jgi:hypothetical protein